MEGLPPSIIIKRTNQILGNCAMAACPPIPKGMSKKRSRLWCANLKPLAKELVRLHRELKNLPAEERVKSPIQASLTAAKKILRKAQRLAAAKQRKDINDVIMEACKEKWNSF